MMALTVTVKKKKNPDTSTLNTAITEYINTLAFDLKIAQDTT